MPSAYSSMLIIGPRGRKEGNRIEEEMARMHGWQMRMGNAICFRRILLREIRSLLSSFCTNMDSFSIGQSC